MDYRDHRVYRASRDLLVLMERRVHRDRRGCPVLTVPLALLDLRDLLAQPVLLVRLELMARLY
jgi:hypothetical protein